MLVKVKTLTKELEAAKKKAPSSASTGFDDLDRALEEELKVQVEKGQKEIQEVRKEMDALKQEKENMTKRLDTLETGNERLVELKEKQDYEMEFLNSKNRDLSSQVSSLQWSLAEEEQRRENEVESLTSQLAVLTDGAERSQDSTALMLEVAALKKELAEATAEADRLRADLVQMTKAHEQALQEVAVVKSQTIDLQDCIDRLVVDKEELEAENKALKVDSGPGAFQEITSLNESLNLEIASLKKTIVDQQSRVVGGSGLVSGGGTRESEDQVERLKVQVAREQDLVMRLEGDLQHKEEELRQMEVELETARNLHRSTQRERQNSMGFPARDSEDRELSGVFDSNLVTENLQLKVDLDNSLKERRQLVSRINTWQQELGKEQILDDEGLRTELRQAIKTLQIKDHKMEELTTENVRLLEERDTLMLKLSTVMRQLEGSRAASAMSSRAGSRSSTPLPQGVLHGVGSIPHFDPHAEIRELHSKLEELRRLNYSLDVELQRERGERQDMGQRIMAPRTRHASQLLPDSPTVRIQDQSVQHM